MSERNDISGEFLGVILILAVTVLCVYISYSHSQVRDLQRRVGQLEQNEKKMVNILDQLARHAASESEQVRR